MEPTFTTKPAFTVVGMLYRGRNETGQEIPQLWDVFIPRRDEIKNRTDIAYGVMGNYDPATGEFDYLAGFGVDRVDDIPEGMKRWDVPEQKYAVFTCTLRTLRQTYDAIYRQWLPQSGHEHAGSVEFELYDEHFEGDDSDMYIYVPIR